MQKLTQTSKRT